EFGKPLDIQTPCAVAIWQDALELLTADNYCGLSLVEDVRDLPHPVTWVNPGRDRTESGDRCVCHSVLGRRRQRDGDDRARAHAPRAQLLREPACLCPPLGVG